MEVLLMENSGRKAQEIISYVQELGHCCKQVFSVESLRRAVSKKMYDLVLIDLHVPEKDAGEISDRGGFKAIYYLRETPDTIYRPQRMITISKYLENNIIVELNDLHVMGIKYDEEEEWKSKLKTELSYIELLTIKKIDILLITAVDIELTETLKIFNGNPVNLTGDNNIYYYCNLTNIEQEKISVVLCKPERMGLVAATNLTAKAIKILKPDCVIMVGIAGGNLKQTSLGDIVVAENSVDYSSGSIEENTETSKITFMPDPNMISINDNVRKVFDSYRLNTDLLYEIRKACDMTETYNSDIKLHLGTMASGPAVIKSSCFTKQYILPHYRKYLAIDMETYGVYYAVRHSFIERISCVSIKSICDGANSNKKDTDQQYCARLAANLAKYYIINDYKKSFL